MDFANVYEVPEDVLQELVLICDDIEMLEQIIGAEELADGTLKRKKSKFSNVTYKDKRRVLKAIQKKRDKIMRKRQEQEELRDYWLTQLNKDRQVNREYADVYDELYDYARVTIENSLRPLKEYYFNNPQDFDPKDANLLDKAFKFTEKLKDK